MNCSKCGHHKVNFKDGRCRFGGSLYAGKSGCMCKCEFPADVPAQREFAAHVLLTPETCNVSHFDGHQCPVCDGGLAICAVCGKAEIELDDPVCKGQRVPAQVDEERCPECRETEHHSLTCSQHFVSDTRLLRPVDHAQGEGEALKLRPCPWCQRQPKTTQRDTLYVFCDTSSCSLKGMGMWSVYGWNTRAHSATVEGLVEALEELLVSWCFDHAGACCREWCDKCQREIAARAAARTALAQVRGEGVE